ncbi:MAG: phosphoribosyltransferase family protein [Candidatus Saccharimonadales bacterium]
MYFENREQAGQLLAAELLEKYRYDDCVVVALSDGAVLVGEQIAKSLHCLLTMLLVEEIEVPGEGISIGGVSENGGFTYNGMFSVGEMEEYNSEYHGYFEQEKQNAFQKINRLLGDGGLINNDMMRDHVVILVADGLDTGASLDVAVEFMKPIRIKRLVMATPISTVAAVDKAHMLADELHILDVKENFMGIDHYYNQNTIPSHEDTIAKINQIVLNWH